MPYSKRFNFVHVALPKTGTTSVIEAMLDLHRRHGAALAWYQDPIDDAVVRKYGLDRSADPLPGHAKHLSAAQLRLILGADFDAAFRFTFVRNPWARAVSRYRFSHEDYKPSLLARWLRGTTRRFHAMEFRDWVRRRARRAEKDGGTVNQLDKLIDADGRLLVQYIGRLETIDESFAEICRRIGVPPFPVPHVNVTTRGEPYTAYYDDWTRAAIATLYHRDIEAFGYEFGT